MPEFDSVVIMYNVASTRVNIVWYAVLRVNSTGCSGVHCLINSLQSSMYCEPSSVLLIHCTVAKCALYTVHCTLYNVHCTLYTEHCTLYIVHCTIHFINI